VAPRDGPEVAAVEVCTLARAACVERALVRACVAGRPAACRDLRLARSLFCGF
jgi:hypothetical protein